MPKEAYIRCRVSRDLKERFTRCLERDGLSETDWIMSRVIPYVEEKEKEAVKVISMEDIRKLGCITTRDEAGTHFTQKCDRDWLDKMEAAGLLEITKPVHEATGIQYSEEHWSVVVTEKGIELGEAHAWGKEE